MICALGTSASSYDAKGDERPTADAMQLAGRMNAALSPTCTPQCPQIAIFRNPTAPNAMLVVTADQAKFVYAPQFFSAVYDKYGDGAIIAIDRPLVRACSERSSPGWLDEERLDAGAARRCLGRVRAGQERSKRERSGGGIDRTVEVSACRSIRAGRPACRLCGSDIPIVVEMAQSSTSRAGGNSGLQLSEFIVPSNMRLLATFFLAGITAFCQQSTAPVAITHVTVINPGTSSVQTNRTVVVTGDRITSVSDARASQERTSD